MLVVDASCLCEVLIGGVGAQAVRDRLASDVDHAAPQVVDLEVVRREYLRGRLDRTEAAQAVADLEAGERFGHRFLLARAWQLRETVRGWEAM